MKKKNFKTQSTQSTQSSFLRNDAEKNKEFNLKPLRSFASFALKKNIFTPVGFAVLIVTLILLIRALVARNAYEIVLSCGVLLLLLVLGLVGFRTSKKLAELTPGWKPPYPFTACAGEPSVVSGLSADIPLFFRLHFAVKGKYSPSYSFTSFAFSALKNCCAETSIPRGENNAQLVMDFPMSGVFQGEGVCKLRDVFGFFSFKCGETLHRTLNIRSSPCFGKDYYINAQSGAEDKRNKHSPDEERYYMREYTPGDRFRDINWKSSEKIDTLITRISPDNQEKVSRIEVYFRNFGKAENPSLEELWLLDRAKARLTHFLRSLKEQQPSFIFDVRAAGRLENWEIEDEESLDAFLEDLAGLGFAPPQSEGAAVPSMAGAKGGELHVFSTACDLRLQSFLTASATRAVTLFLVQGTRDEGRGTRDNGSLSKNETERFSFGQKPLFPEVLYKRDFLLKGIIPKPKWLFYNKINPINAQATKTEIIYAGTRL